MIEISSIIPLFGHSNIIWTKNDLNILLIERFSGKMGFVKFVLQYIFLLPLTIFFDKIFVSEREKKKDKNNEKMVLDILK